MRDVGDVHADLERAVLVLDDVKRVIEIPGGGGVDREHAVVAEVAAYLGRRLALWDGPRRRREALDDAVGEVCAVI